MIGKEGIPQNDPHEAYTGNSMGRKEDGTLPKQFSLVTAYAGGDAKTAEANTKRIDSTFLADRACSGIEYMVRPWHVEREASGTWETLVFPVNTSRAFQRNEGSPMSLRESDRFIVL
ncbi:MAG: hypothetical protein C0403_10355 [Desulfobacterium sp.]|nr:hypothetical protein [Desulfobacterium sp.]